MHVLRECGANSLMPKMFITLSVAYKTILLQFGLKFNLI